MPFSVPDKSNVVTNGQPASFDSSSTQRAADTAQSNSINQLRGAAVANGTAVGIPSHVSGVAASIANATKGATSTITVTYSRDPGDRYFYSAKVYLKGYQNNQTPTLIATSSDSPISFILNNTGENISLIVAASGNAGDASLTTAPTTGLKLPKSSGGGYGTTTTTTTVVPSTYTPPVLPFIVGAAGCDLAAMANMASGSIENTSNLVQVTKIHLQAALTVGHAAWTTTSGVVSVTYAFGIYDSSGNKLVDTGVQTSRNGTFSAAVTSTVLPAGDYWLAQTQAAGNALGFTGFSTSNFALMNKVTTKFGTAANASSVGVLPATLGVITADSSGLISVAVLWEP